MEKNNFVYWDIAIDFVLILTDLQMLVFIVLQSLLNAKLIANSKECLSEFNQTLANTSWFNGNISQSVEPCTKVIRYENSLVKIKQSNDISEDLRHTVRQQSFLIRFEL